MRPQRASGPDPHRFAPRAALLVLAAALAACGGQPAADSAAPPPALETLTVRMQAGPGRQVWDGVVEAVHQVTITAQTNARVLALPHEVNDVVPEGAVLVRFSDVEQKSARDAARAGVAAAGADAAEAQANYARVAAVYAKGYVSVAQMDRQRAARDAAQAALRAARAQLADAGQALDYTVLRAPFAGVVTKRYVHVGQAVQAGPPTPQPLIELQALDALRVNVVVPQAAADAIRASGAAEVTTVDGQGVVAGTAEVFPYADPATHTFNVRVALPAGQRRLYPGMTVKVAFAAGATQELTLPASALLRRGELTAVYVVGAYAVTLRQVRTGSAHGDQIEVLAGLDAGERVARDPAAALAWLLARREAGGGHGG